MSKGSSMRTRLLAALSATAIAGGALAVPTLAAGGGGAPVKVTNSCVSSVPEPGSSDPVKICYTMFQPAGADARHPVPMVFHSHGWGGSRTTDPAAFTKFLDAGFGVLSLDQRGFDASGGKAHVENPDYEGRDVEKLVS